jgi:hypothetical protein
MELWVTLAKFGGTWVLRWELAGTLAKLAELWQKCE